MKKGYAYDVEEVNKIAKLLEENAEWVESFDVSGENLTFKDIEKIDEDELKERLRSK